MSHVRWEDLLAEEESSTPGNAAASRTPEPAAPPSLEEVAAVDSDLAALLRERKQLEGRMNALLGVEEAPVDARMVKQFPVVEHTPESRIADRKQHERDTARRLLEQKLYARRRAEADEAERVEELRRKRLETARANRRRELQQASLRQQWARKARERAKLAARLAERFLQRPPSGPGVASTGAKEAARRLSEVAEEARSAARRPMPLARGLPLPGAGKVGGGTGLALGGLTLPARGAGRMGPRSLEGGMLMERGLAAGGMDLESMERRMDMELERDGGDAMAERDTARDAQRERGRGGARDE
jgi:hypothetical protein